MEEKKDDYNKNEISKKNILSNNFDIKEKKYPILELKLHHEERVTCLILLKDGRMTSGSNDNSIIIYNKISYKPDLIIKEHSNSVNCLLELSSGILASCSDEIILFKIYGNYYDILQILDYSQRYIIKIIKLKNTQLVSCSYDYDKSIIIFSKENNEYKMDYSIGTGCACCSVIETKNNEICYSYNDGNWKYNICFYDLLRRKKIKTIFDIKGTELFMIKEDLLLVGGDIISLININTHNQIRSIDHHGGLINIICKLNENMILIGHGSSITQCKIEGDNLIILSDKEQDHYNDVWSLLNIPNNHFASGYQNGIIKIW